MTEKRRSKDVRKRIEHKLKVVEKRDRMLIKDRSSERAVMEEVFDRSTLMTVYDFLNRGIISEIFGVVKAGKEARVYWGKDSEQKELAIKIYLTVSAEFKRGMLPYIEGDPRFAHVRRGTRSLVYAWTQKEFKNLQRAYDVGVRVPQPVAASKNVLIMEFIGEEGVSAPLMKEIALQKPQETLQKLLIYVRKLYQEARLVHADLSEYNIMIWHNEPVLFDVSQSVLLEHPMANKFLQRDLENLYRHFKRLDVAVPSQEEMYRWVISAEK
ncbi:MAG: serine protein kinase RIO [Candidatus Bathyarchaeota archaeon]|nr:serine protein kinase RIO [Candidatus Bathyarchaeota archaeon]MDH5733902.1 serine protein kinase RIO [Candidatus Bathyarchaeota archaeon]